MKTLEEILHRKNDILLTVNNDTSIRDACRYFSEYEVGSLIVEDNDSICGIFTERDVKAVLAMGLDPCDTTVGDAMTGKVIVGEVDENVHDALRAMVVAQIHHLPVVDAGNVVGILSMHDLVRAVYGTRAPEPHYLEPGACPTCGQASMNDRDCAA